MAQSMQNTKKKRDILTEKQQIGMALEKLDFPSENANVDTVKTLPYNLDGCGVCEPRYSQQLHVHIDLIPFHVLNVHFDTSNTRRLQAT